MWVTEGGFSHKRTDDRGASGVTPQRGSGTRVRAAGVLPSLHWERAVARTQRLWRGDTGTLKVTSCPGDPRVVTR